MRRTLPAEIGLAQPRELPQRYGTHWRHLVTAEELMTRAEGEDTIASLLIARAMWTAGQEAGPELRTALIELAALTISWIERVDSDGDAGAVA